MQGRLPWEAGEAAAPSVAAENPKLALYYWETNILSIVLMEKSLKTNIYPCGGTYICIDVPSEEALLPACPRYAQASLKACR